MALAILRLYCQTENPTTEMKSLVYFICGCYAPMYFKIKTDWHCTDGAKNLHLTQKLAKQSLTGREDDYNTVLGYIAINSYYGHPENVLLSAVFYHDQNVPEKAVRQIFEVRSYWNENPGLQQFRLQYKSIIIMTIMIGKLFQNLTMPVHPF